MTESAQALQPATAPTVPPSALTTENLQAKIKELDDQTDIDESLKSKVLDLYRLAITQREAAQLNDTSAAVYKQMIETAPIQPQQLDQQLKEPMVPRSLTSHPTRWRKMPSSGRRLSRGPDRLQEHTE